MIGIKRTCGWGTMALLLVTILVLMLMSGCGGDKQDDPPQQTNQESISDQGMVPESDSYGADSQALHPDEMAEVEAKPFSPPPTASAEEETVVPGHQSQEPSFAKPVSAPASPPGDSSKGELVKQIGGDYSLMVGSFQKKINATLRMEKLQKLGFRPVQETATIEGQEFFRVYLRGIESKDEAENLGSFLKGKLNIEYLVLIR